jgi:hypothetical protein
LVAADTPLFDGGVSAFSESWAGGMAKSLSDGPTAGSKALQLLVSVKPEQVWGAQTWVTPLTADIKAGDALQIHFKARCTAPADHAGILNVSVSKNGDPYTTVLLKALDISGEWKEYNIEEPAQEGLASTELRFGFMVGNQIQTIEIADLTAVKHDK